VEARITSFVTLAGLLDAAQALPAALHGWIGLLTGQEAEGVATGLRGAVDGLVELKVAGAALTAAVGPLVPRGHAVGMALVLAEIL
jgi:hypothetical protein